MKTGLALFSITAFAAMLIVSIWATAQVSIVPVIVDLWTQPASGNNPWLVATLFDAYFGFLWFWLWVAYKETSWTARVAWLAAFLVLGNMGMAAYLLLQLVRLPKGATIEDLLLRRS
ncbi:MAG TPA: DUF1475 family protein [Nevskiaceae bacterium]|nr:DUF1475 family protein [Nevskiaceae bacterium]